MKHVDYFKGDKLLKGERFIASLDGWIGDAFGKGDKAQQNGALVLTDQRLAFIRKGFFGEVFESIPLPKLTSVETRSFMGHRVATFHTSHDELNFKTFASKSDFTAMVESVEARSGRSAEGTTPPPPSNLVAQLEGLAALKQIGSLTPEEYDLAKTYLLRHGNLPTGASEIASEHIETREPMVGRTSASPVAASYPPPPSRGAFWKVAAGIGALSVLWIALSGEEAPPTARAQQNAGTTLASPIAAPAVRSATSSACTMGSEGSGEIVAVTGSYDPRQSPSEGGQRFKNEKASAALGNLHFHTIDDSTTVKQLCADGEWSEVQIVTPEWLTHVKGWVPNRVLRKIRRTDDGRRLYVEADFYWDEHTSGYKSQIVEAVNKIARETNGCAELDPYSMSLSGSKSSPNNPVFYVTCTEASLPFNVWFRP